MLTIIAIASNTNSIKIDAMDAEVSKIMSKKMPRKISQIDIIIIIKGIFSDKEKKIISRSASNCPVHHSLSEDMEINLDIQYR